MIWVRGLSFRVSVTELDLFFLPRFLSTEASSRNGHRLFNHRDTRGFEVSTVMFSFCCFVLVCASVPEFEASSFAGSGFEVSSQPLAGEEDSSAS